MDWKIPLFKMYWDNADLKAVESVIMRGSYWAEGPEIKKFEEEFAKFVGAKFALAMNSGTAALHTALLAQGIREKEVIVPSFTFIATANAVLLAGGKPVFAEIENETYGLDAEDVEKKISEKTAAIIPVHYAGIVPRDMKALKEISEKNSLFLLEDVAEALGAKQNGKNAGSFGHAGAFSLCQNKIITTGEGGALVTDSEEIVKKARLYRSHGRSESNYFSSTLAEDYVEAGYNYRMPSILAALASSQLKKAGKIIEMRRKKAEYFCKKISKAKGIRAPKEINGNFDVYEFFTLELESMEKRDALQKFLAEKGIMSKIYFSCVHLKTLYRNLGWKKGDLPFTESISDRVLTMPFFPQIKKEEIDLIAEAINGFAGAD